MKLSTSIRTLSSRYNSYSHLFGIGGRAGKEGRGVGYQYQSTAAHTSSIVPFKLTDIGEGIAEVELLKWFVKEGDVIRSFDRVCEVQSDKATVEITSRYGGVVKRIHHSEGSIVKVGSSLVDIETDPSPSHITSDSLSAEQGHKIHEIDQEVNHDTSKGMNQEVIEVIQELAHSLHGAGVEGEVLVSVHSYDQSSPSFPAFILPPPSTISSSPSSSPSSSSSSSSSSSIFSREARLPPSYDKTNPGERERRLPLTTPAVRKIAKERGIDLFFVDGTGPGGRILKEDLDRNWGGGGGGGDVDLGSIGWGSFKSMATALSHNESMPHQSVPALENSGSIPHNSSSVRDNMGTVSAEWGEQRAREMVDSMVRERVMEMERERNQSLHTPPTQPLSSIPLPPMDHGKRVVAVRGLQRLMVKSMTASLRVPQLSFADEINCDQLMVFKKKAKDEMKEEMKREAKRESNKGVNGMLAGEGVGGAGGAGGGAGGGSIMPLIIKATSLALKVYPIMNVSVLCPDCSEIVYNDNHNIGIAMDTPKGLLVPVIKQVQLKSISQISLELSILQSKAKAGTLSEGDMQGGTFTLSNIGSIGGTSAIPLVTVPQVAIGAMGKMQVLPRYSEIPFDSDLPPPLPTPTTIMTVNWSADHRVVDGATVARFSQRWKGYIEQPNSMLRDMV